MLLPDIQENWDALEYENHSIIPKIKYPKTYVGKKYTLVERIGQTPRTPNKQRQMQRSTEFKSGEKLGQKMERESGNYTQTPVACAPILSRRH